MTEGGLHPEFAIHVPQTIPVQLVATDTEGTDWLVGDFSGGVVLNGMTLQDVATHTIIASFSIRQRMWVIKGKNYQYIFAQVKPVD